MEYIYYLKQWIKLLLKHSQIDLFVFNSDKMHNLAHHLTRFKVVPSPQPVFYHLAPVIRRKNDEIEFEIDNKVIKALDTTSAMQIDLSAWTRESYVQSFKNQIFQMKDYSTLDSLDFFTEQKSRFSEVCIPSIFTFDTNID